jgi:hypothetical protein
LRIIKASGEDFVGGSFYAQASLAQAGDAAAKPQLRKRWRFQRMASRDRYLTGPHGFRRFIPEIFFCYTVWSMLTFKHTCGQKIPTKTALLSRFPQARSLLLATSESISKGELNEY